MVCKGVIVPAGGADAPAGRSFSALRAVANRPIVCHVLSELRRAGAREVALVLAAAEIRDVRANVATDGPADLRVVEIPYEDEGARVQALERAARFVADSPCIVHVSDGLLAQPLAPLCALLSDDAADLVVPVAERTGETDSTGLAIRRLLRLANAGATERRSEGAKEPAGVRLFGPGALRRACETAWWPGPELELVSLAERVVANGGRLRVERVRGWRRCSGEVADLLELNRFVLDTLTLTPLPVPIAATRVAENRFEGYVAIDPSASVRSSVIVGPAIVGAGACVVESYIGPYTSVGAGVRIEGAEVERSIILPGASIMHVGGRLTASVVGRDARVFRDFSLPRALRLNVGDGGEVALC